MVWLCTWVYHCTIQQCDHGYVIIAILNMLNNRTSVNMFSQGYSLPSLNFCFLVFFIHVLLVGMSQTWKADLRHSTPIITQYQYYVHVVNNVQYK